MVGVRLSWDFRQRLRMQDRNHTWCSKHVKVLEGLRGVQGLGADQQSQCLMFDQTRIGGCGSNLYTA